jgi:hypothetical protein
MSEKIPLIDTRLGTRLRQLQQDARARRCDEINHWVGRHSTPDGIQRLVAASAKLIVDHADMCETRAKGGGSSAGFTYEPHFLPLGASIPGTGDYELQRLAEFQQTTIPQVERALERQFGFTAVKITYQRGYFSLEIVF